LSTEAVTVQKPGQVVDEFIKDAKEEVKEYKKELKERKPEK